MAKITVVLTFDDGPHALSNRTDNYTAQAVRALRNNSVNPNTKAAFFVQTHVPHRGGNRVGREIITAIQAEGHVVGIHTGSKDDHALHTRRQAAGLLEDDLVAAAAYLKQLGISNPFVRPPERRYNAEVLQTYRSLGLKMVLWDIDSRDSHSGYSKQRIAEQLRQGLQAAAASGKTDVVVLFHELDSDTRGNIEHYMTTLKDAAATAGHEAVFPTTREEVSRVLLKNSGS